ncbi:MAG: AAA family ATPase [Candidatus Micrarchaeota archaeon]|nr:AAA family ATPase [Candidatus Micrarchaeota archaeon]
MGEFSELLEQGTVFRNRDILSPHYVPNKLIFREAEVKRLMVALAPALKNSKPRNLFIYGQTGTGKTATVKQVIRKLAGEKQDGVKTVYMNCRIYDSRYKAVQKCISEHQPDFAKTGYSFAVLYEKLLDWIEESGGKQFVVALDEVDVVKDLDSLVYTLTRANDDLKKGNISMIGISNRVSFKQRLDVRSKSSLCEEEIVFQPYDATQLRGILLQRVPEAFKDGAVEESALNLAAAIAAKENGDARYALNLLFRAGELAEGRGMLKVADKEVEEARKMADEDKAFEVISTLPEHQQFVLYGLASLALDTKYRKLVEEGGDKLYFSSEVYERYCSLAKRGGQEPRTSRWFREYLHDLETLGLVATIESGKGVRGHATLVKLCYEALKVRKIIEKTLFEDKGAEK